jgi:hypothetical protein
MEAMGFLPSFALYRQNAHLLMRLQQWEQQRGKNEDAIRL